MAAQDLTTPLPPVAVEAPPTLDMLEVALRLGVAPPTVGVAPSTVGQELPSVFSLGLGRLSDTDCFEHSERLD